MCNASAPLTCNDMLKKKTETLFLMLFAAIMSIVIAGCGVVQFHHHDSDGCICLTGHERHHGAHSADSSDGSCSLHIDKYVGQKHHFCSDVHCAVHFAPIFIFASEDAKPRLTPALTAPLTEPPILLACALRAPPGED